VADVEVHGQRSAGRIGARDLAGPRASPNGPGWDHSAGRRRARSLQCACERQHGRLPIR
jgi:hypothetical protein